MSTLAPPNAGDAGDAGDAVPGLSISVTGKIMLSGVVAFFFLFVFLLILFLRANRYFGANPTLTRSQAGSVFPALGAVGAPFIRGELDPALLKSLPVTVISSLAFKDGKECAVCLSEFADGDTARFLPGCGHGFHLECIDKWFGSNSTCPICRSSIKPPAVDSKKTILDNSEQSSTINIRAFPHGIVIPVTGSGEGSSSSVCSVSRNPNQIFAVDIPRIASESSAFALHSSRILSAVELKSPNFASLRLLRRILSMGSRGIRSPCSSIVDIEQGAPSAVSPSASAAGAGSDGDGSSSNKKYHRDLSLVEEVFFMKEGKRIAMR